MENICPICVKQPNAHSFMCLCQTISNKYIFYTKFASAKLYNDTEGILKHHENLLNFVNPSSWIWIVDCNGFGLKHSLEIKTAFGLLNMIRKNGNVHRILIINANSFIYNIYKIVKLSLNEDLQKKTVFIKPAEKNIYIDELNNFKLSDENYNMLNNFME